MKGLKFLNRVAIISNIWHINNESVTTNFPSPNYRNTLLSTCTCNVCFFMIEYTVDLPCLTNDGVAIIDAYINFSAIVNGSLFNNSFNFFFHRNCTEENTSKYTKYKCT